MANQYSFVFGLLGNIISFLVFLSPIPTFYRVFKKKSTEGFQSVPYVVALFSSMLWIYYALIKTDAFLIITINAFGVFIETIYLIIFITYAPPKARILAAKFILLLDIGIFGSVFLLTYFLAKGPLRVTIVGWICVGFAMCVFAAPLSIMRLVIRTKSIEFMPFFLSLFLTISAVVWFFYGLSLNDWYIIVPNILGFVLGILQMILYLCYRNAKPNLSIDEEKQIERVTAEIKMADMASGTENGVSKSKDENGRGPNA